MPRRGQNLLTPKYVGKARRDGMGGATGRFPDGGGLYLVIKQTARGVRALWHFRYVAIHEGGSGKESMLSFGPYPDVGRDDARASRTRPRHSCAMGKTRET